MNFQGVIFDLDGTLLDTLEDIAVSVNSVLARFGLPTHGVDAYRNFIGDGVSMLVTRALPAEKRAAGMVADCARAFRENYSRNWNVNTKQYKGVEELLRSLSAKHVKMAVLSNKPHDFTDRCVHELLPNHRFEMILGQREGVPSKPDPTGALEIAASLSIAPSRFLYLGDSGVDMDTAIGAGMFAVGALWGFRLQKELLEHGAQAVIKRPTELLRLLD